MKKNLPLPILLLFTIAGYSQEIDKVAAQKLGAKLKESTDLTVQTRLNSKFSFQPDLKPLGSKASSNRDESGFTRLIADAEKATRADLKEVVKFDAGSLELTFSLSSAFAGIATNMAILEPKEAEKVNLAVTKANNAWKYISGGVAAAGTVFTAAQLLGKADNMNPKKTLAINMAALVPLVINTFSKPAGPGSAEVSSEINRAIASAATYAYQKGQRLAVHAFLSVEISKVNGKLESLRALAAGISAKSKQPLTDAELFALGTELIALIDETDTFFSSTILNMQAAIKEHSTVQLYDQNTQNRLAALSSQIVVALASWDNMKIQYKKHQNLITNAVTVLQ